MSARRWILFLLLLAAVPCAAQAAEAAQTADAAQTEDLGEACTYHRPTFDRASENTPRYARAGNMTVSGFSIPAYAISLSNPLRASGFATYTPGKRGPKIKLTQEMAGRLEAYATPMGTVLVPGGWTPRSGAEGADGSFVIYFTPDAGGASYMSVESTSACVGCAYSSASWYFKSARVLAKNNGFVYCRSAAGVHSLALNPVQRAYRIKTAGGDPVDGLAYFNPDDDLMFYEVEISLPAAQHALATAVLNQFVIARKSK